MIFYYIIFDGMGGQIVGLEPGVWYIDILTMCDDCNHDTHTKQIALTKLHFPLTLVIAKFGENITLNRLILDLVHVQYRNMFVNCDFEIKITLYWCYIKYSSVLFNMIQSDPVSSDLVWSGLI